MFKRTLAFLLVLTTILSLGPALVLADEGAEGTPVPEASETPETVEDPEASEEPETPEATEGPEATQTPEVSAEPETTEEPEASTEPETTEQPEAPGEPEASAEPEATAEPETTTEPLPQEEPLPEDELSVPPEASQEPEPSEEPTRKVWPWTEPGNSTLALMNGGLTLEDGQRYYLCSGGLRTGLPMSEPVMLTNENAANLNLSGGWLYYTVGSEIKRMAPTGGGIELYYAFTANIDQMYVMGQEIRFMSDGGLYSLDMNDGVLETLEAPAGAVKFLPTPYGNLFFSGQFHDYSLLADGSPILTGMRSCYSDGDWLVVTIGEEIYQAPLADAFAGSVSLQSYTLHQDEIPVNALSDEQQLANEQAYLESSEYAAIQASVAASDNGIATISTSKVLTEKLTTNQQNIVLRAEQMAQVTWKSQKNIYAWGGDNPSYVTSKYGAQKNPIRDVDGYSSTDAGKAGYFLKDHTYKGVPYSQAVHTGYVGWGISLQGFIDATADKNSKFYSGYSTYDKTAPYYGSDCSGFVSYAWDVPQRCTCSTLVKYAKYIGSGANMVQSLQVGDALDNTGSHVMLVTDLGYENGKIVSVEITEQTPPKMKVTVYGPLIDGKTVKGEDYDAKSTIEALVSYYLQAGYGVYRRSYSGSVSRPKEVQGMNRSDTPEMTVTASGPSEATITLTHKDGGTIYYTTDGSTATKSSHQYSAPFKVTNPSGSGSIPLRAMAIKDGKESFMLSAEIGMSGAPTPAVAGSTDGSGVFYYNSEYYIADGKKLTLSVAGGGTIYYTTDGKDPTVSSAKAASGQASITVTDGMTVKAFAACDGCLPSAVATFRIKIGAMRTITLDDPYGLVTPTVASMASAKSITVREGTTIKFTVSSKSDVFELDYFTVDVPDAKDPAKKYAKDYPNGLQLKADKDYQIKVYVKSAFTDVKSNAWYAAPIAYMSGEGLMDGTSKGVFSPNYGASRAMFITVLGRYDAQHNGGSFIVSTSGTTTSTVSAKDVKPGTMYGITRGTDIYLRGDASTKNTPRATLPAEGQILQVTSTANNDSSIWYKVKYNWALGSSTGSSGYISRVNPTNNKVLLDVCAFTDTSSSNVSYCYGYVQWAYLNDIIDGVSSAKFGSTNGISRQDICVILYNYLKYRGYKLDTSDTAAKKFSDYGSVASYAREGVCAMVNAGIINGSNGKLQPTAVAYRCHVAQFIYNLDQFING